MTNQQMYKNVEYGIGYTIQNCSMPRQFKQYKRNGKTYWRNYNRDVKGGVSFAEFLQKHIEEHRRYLYDA